MTSVATRNGQAIDDRLAFASAEPAAAPPRSAPLALLSRLVDAAWYRRSVHAQLLLTVILIELVAALVAGGVER